MTPGSPGADLAFAAAVILAPVGWDLFDTHPLTLGVAGHELYTVLVRLNGVRLLVRPDWLAPAVVTRPKPGLLPGPGGGNRRW